MSERAKRVQIGRSNAGAWRRVSALPFPGSPRPGALYSGTVFSMCASDFCPPNTKGVSCLIPTRPDRPDRPGPGRPMMQAFLFSASCMHACISYVFSFCDANYGCWCFGGWLEIRVGCPEMRCCGVWAAGLGLELVGLQSLMVFRQFCPVSGRIMGSIPPFREEGHT